MTEGGRTPEERERARLEREAKRAERDGRPPPEPPAPEVPPPAPPAPRSAPEPQPAAKSPPAVGRPQPPPPLHASTHTTTRERRRGPRVLALLAALALLAGWFAVALFQPFAGDGEGSVRVTIPRGASVGEIADLLEDRGVVSSAFFFRTRATLSGRGDELKAGNFTLSEGMSISAALDALAEAPAANVVTITIPEGRARREVDELLGDRLEGDYLAASRRSPALDPADYDAEGARSLEGFLYPATYELKRGRGVKALVTQQLDAFERELDRVDLRFARRKNLTAYDVLIIASMVEREAAVARERPLIASVIYNRLRDGIPLGIDATIRFATNNWTEPLRESELDIASPYNTRTRQGLPPGPIGSPGLDSIRAAARPARTDSLYFVVKPNTCGEHDFSRTLAEHNAKVARYNRERDERGGRSPTDC